MDCLLVLALTLAQVETTGDGYTRSIELVEAELRERPENPGLLRVLGHVHFRRHRFEESAKTFGRLTKLAPKSFDAWMGFAAASSELGNDERAIEALRRAIPLASPHASIPARFRFAELLRRKGDLSGALRELRVVIEVDPSQRDVWIEIGDALRAEARQATNEENRRQKLEESVRALEKSIRLDPKSHRAHYVLGMVQRRRGRIDLARSLLERSRNLRVPPGVFRPVDKTRIEAEFEASTALELVGIAVESRELAKAIRFAERAVSLTPDSPEALTTKAGLLMRERNLGEAAKIYSRVLEIEANHPGALVRLGSIHIANQDVDAGGDLLLRATRAHPNHAEAWEILFLLAAQKRFAAKRAEEFGRGALRTRPSAKNFRGLGLFLASTAREREALAVIDAGLARYPANESLTNARRQIAKTTP